MYIGRHAKSLLLLSDLNELEFFRQIFEKYSNQISRTSVQWELSCSVQMDGHDEDNCRFSQVCESA